MNCIAWACHERLVNVFWLQMKSLPWKEDMFPGLILLCFKSYKLVLSPSVWLLAPGYRLRSSDQKLLKVEAAGDLQQVRLETWRTVLGHCCRWYLLTSRGQPVPTDVEEKRRVMENVLKRRSEFKSECLRCRKTGRECHPENVWALKVIVDQSKH